jgi:divalent metal cation (Fe/Co/Zn/Cd) transporter/ribosome-associated protein YbcJ (S4-like RNA binding protein)
VLLAKEITTRFHSAAAADAAHDDFQRRAAGGVPDEIPSGADRRAAGHRRLLKQAGLVPSTSEGLRLVEQGGVRVDGSVVSDKGLKLPAGSYVVQVGKRKFARVTLGRLMQAVQVASYLKLSVAVALATIALKTGAWWVSGSVSLLSDALESLVNLAGAMFALAMVVAARPPDDDHPYGHHKAEYFSSGFEGVLIFAAALAIIWAAVQRCSTRSRWSRWAWAWCCRWSARCSTALLAWACCEGAQHRSMALEADARHLFTDVWTSAGVVVGLLAVHGHRLALAGPGDRHRGGAEHPARRRLAGLALGRGPDGQRARARGAAPRSTSTLAGFGHQTIRFDHVVTRRAGQRRFVDLHMHMPAGWTLGRAAAVRTASVEQALMSAVPGLRASIQLLPMDVEAHFDDSPKDPL